MLKKLLSITLIVLLAMGAFTFAYANSGPFTRSAEFKQYDENKDKIFENLQYQMDKRDSNETLSTIVLFEKNFYRNAEFKSYIQEYTVKHQYNNIPAVVMELTKTEIQNLAKRDNVVHIEHNEKLSYFIDTAKESFGAAKAVTDFGLDGDRDGNPNVYSKEDVVIAVIDSGVDRNHVDFANGKIISWQHFHQDAIPPDDDIDTSRHDGDPEAHDHHGHGTHVAGIALGQGNGNSMYKGVAPGAALVAISVDSSGLIFTIDVLQAIDWCIDNKDEYGIDIINLSLGSSTSSNGTDSKSLLCNAAVESGIVVCTSAGNSGDEQYTIGSPAAAEKVITVGLFYDLGEQGFAIHSRSSRGPTADNRVKPDICGPGVNIMAPKANSVNQYVTKSGTSMSSPFVAGTIALMLDANPSLTPAQIKSILADTALDWGPLGKDNDYGFGRLDVYGAIKLAGNYTGSNIQTPNHFSEQYYLGNEDTHKFEITINNALYPITVTTIMTGDIGTRKYRLILSDDNQCVSYISNTESRQEQIKIYPSSTGKYTVRIDSLSGTGNYILDISAGFSNVVKIED